MASAADGFVCQKQCLQANGGGIFRSCKSSSLTTLITVVTLLDSCLLNPALFYPCASIHLVRSHLGALLCPTACLSKLIDSPFWSKYWKVSPTYLDGDLQFHVRFQNL